MYRIDGEIFRLCDIDNRNLKKEVTNMNKNKLSTVCMSVGAICFAIVSYGNFYRGNIALAVVTLLATAMNVVSVILINAKFKNKQ